MKSPMRRINCNDVFVGIKNLNRKWSALLAKESVFSDSLVIIPDGSTTEEEWLA